MVSLIFTLFQIDTADKESILGHQNKTPGLNADITPIHNRTNHHLLPPNHGFIVSALDTVAAFDRPHLVRPHYRN